MPMREEHSQPCRPANHWVLDPRTSHISFLPFPHCPTSPTLPYRLLGQGSWKCPWDQQNVPLDQSFP